MFNALVTGCTGQDGSYMAELLLAKGYRVIGTVKDIEDGRKKLPTHLIDKVQLVECNVSHPRSIERILAEYRPREVYNFAAYSSGAKMFADPVGIGEVNGLAVTRILEAIRDVDNDIRFCQASSSEVFGSATTSPQSEETSCAPRSPYGAAKLYADSMIRIYRSQYGVFACSAILFNHESPRRGFEFVTRKISREVAKIKLGLANELHLGNLEARRDWGFAGDYVRAMWLMLQRSQAADFVVATGETRSVRELCEIAFGHLGLDYREFVKENSCAFRPSEQVQLVGDPTKAKTQLDWAPQIGVHEMVCMMVDADLSDLIKRDRNLSHG